MPQSRLRTARINLFITLVYLIAGKLGLTLAFVNDSATAVWAPTGIALAALVVFGRDVWPGIFLGAFLVNLTTTGSVAPSIGIALGNTLEGVAGAWLVNRFARGRQVFDRSGDVFRLALLAGMGSTTISATLGVASLCLFGLASMWSSGPIWLTWWLGDAVGDLIVAPLAVLWTLNPRWEWNRPQTLESILLLVSVFLVGTYVFCGVIPPSATTYSLGVLCFPLLVWPAFHFGQRETASAAFLLSGIALFGTTHGMGPFATRSPNESLLSLQVFMGIGALTAVAIAAEVSKRKQFEAELVDLADHDSLTGLLTRRRFISDLNRQLVQGRRYDAHGALMFLDLDGFKAVNDSFGHLVGDDLLRSLSALLHRGLRESDHLGRLGGDEFAILMPHTERRQAEALARRLQWAIATHAADIGRRRITVTASIGLALFPEHGTTVEDLIAHADIAMYEAKEAGSNLLRVYGEDLGWRKKMANKYEGESVIRAALQQGRFVLHAQPILDLRHNEIWRHELLLRIVGEDGQLTRPGPFLSAAERSGLMSPIDHWVVREAIQLVALQVEVPGVCVNLSDRAFFDGELLATIRRDLWAASIDPRRLVLEFTERAALAAGDPAHDFLSALKMLGCELALDDFGLGFSSLAWLERTPVDYLKIDGSFIRDLPVDPAQQDVVEVIVEMARVTNKKTIAESVEENETIRLLRERGVDYAQGNHIGRPRAGWVSRDARTPARAASSARWRAPSSIRWPGSRSKNV